MMKTKEIKTRALDRLNSGLGQAVAVTALYALLNILIQLLRSTACRLAVYLEWVPADTPLLFSRSPILAGINIIFVLLQIIVVSPVVYGSCWWFLQRARGGDPPIRGMLICYSSKRLLLKTASFRFLQDLIATAAALPAGICFLLMVRSTRSLLAYNSGPWFALAVCFGILTLCGIIFWCWFVLRFALAPYLFVLNPDRSVRQILRLSFQMMRGRQTRILLLVGSFWPWFASCALVFPVFFVLPYFSMCYAVLMNRIISQSSLK